MKNIIVAAGVLINENGDLLITERPPGKNMSGFWEFPGGKLEGSETPELALVRELKEELEIIVLTTYLKPLTFITHEYPQFNLLMLVYILRKWEGNPVSAEKQKLAWVSKERLQEYDMLPADKPIISILTTQNFNPKY
ncbi:MAG: 8-oxo-dGTP diphosphatase MutT [Rhodospirillaceae bacterium]|nr:8-oxo-dGTP diphosphatase MutT [Rhodospirillaceae bacterium]